MWDIPERDKVILVRESHHALAVLFRYREEVFQYVSQPYAEARGKVVEYQVRVLFGNGRVLIRFDVVSELNVVKGEVNSWAVREMRNDHRICTSKPGQCCS